MYSSGVWVVKKGHEDEFAHHWQASADQVALAFPGITFRLLRDTTDRRRFASLGGPWRSAEQIASARQLPSFQEAMATIEGIVDSGEIAVYELVAEIS